MTISAHDLMESYIMMRYDQNDLDHIPPFLSRIIIEFQICLSIKNSKDFKGPYDLTQIICNYLYKKDGVEFNVRCVASASA